MKVEFILEFEKAVLINIAPPWPALFLINVEFILEFEKEGKIYYRLVEVKNSSSTNYIEILHLESKCRESYIMQYQNAVYIPLYFSYS